MINRKYPFAECDRLFEQGTKQGLRNEETRLFEQGTKQSRNAIVVKKPTPSEDRNETKQGLRNEQQKEDLLEITTRVTPDLLYITTPVTFRQNRNYYKRVAVTNVAVTKSTNRSPYLLAITS